MPSLTITVCPRLGISLQGSLLQIVGYRNLVAEVEKFRREAYDCENAQHEEMLMKVQAQPHHFTHNNTCLDHHQPLLRQILWLHLFTVNHH